MRSGRSDARRAVASLPLAAAAAAILWAAAIPAAAQTLIGDVITVGFDFCPIGWLPVNGQLLLISEHPALFDVIGDSYGGDGDETFAVPVARPILTADRKALMQCIATQGDPPS